MIFVDDSNTDVLNNKPLFYTPGSNWAYNSASTNALFFLLFFSLFFIFIFFSFFYFHFFYFFSRLMFLRKQFQNDCDYWKFPLEEIISKLGWILLIFLLILLIIFVLRMYSTTLEMDGNGTFTGSSFFWADVYDWARFA